jgi:hypothetical protein
MPPVLLPVVPAVGMATIANSSSAWPLTRAFLPGVVTLTEMISGVAYFGEST